MIDTREELLIALREAAELEQGLMAQYLYAGMTLKSVADASCTSAQLAVVEQWRQSIYMVARQEMAHLGTVQNVITVIGGAPHLEAPAFPQTSKFYDPPQAFKLESLTLATIERFIAFEAPETKSKGLRELQPDPLIYRSVGDLYNQISNGLGSMAEGDLFIGPSNGQDVTSWSASVQVLDARTLVKARAAIEHIIEEGEATTSAGPGSHFQRFLTIRQEYTAVLATDPGFIPYLTVCSNPTTVAVGVAGRTLITHSSALGVAELFNASYLLLQCALVQYYKFQDRPDVPLPGVDSLTILRGVCIGLMQGVLRPLGQNILPYLPADATGRSAGPCFETYAPPTVPWDRTTAWHVLAERAALCHASALSSIAVHERMADVAAALENIKLTLHELTPLPNP